MQPYLRLFSNEKSNCPFCTDEKHAGKRRRYTPRQLRKHFNDAHSIDGKWKLMLGEVTRGKRSWYRKIFRDFSIEGPCGCGCGRVLHYPLHTHNHKHVWAMPDHAPPYYASGHLSRLRGDNSGRFHVGHTPWTAGKAGTGLVKPNSGTWAKNHQPWNSNGGVANAQGYIYIRSTERHKCGAAKYISRARTIGAQLAGRPLTPNDVVLHLDGNPGNDDPANLKVVTRAESINLKRHKFKAGRPRKLLNEIIMLGEPTPAPAVPGTRSEQQPHLSDQLIVPVTVIKPLPNGYLREKTKDETPTLPAHKVDSILISREKIDIPPSVKPVFLGPTCPNCGMLRLDPTVLCRHCGPDARPRAHKPPSPTPMRKVRRWRSASSNPLDDESDWDRKEVRP